MEEADALAERIVIVSEGKLRVNEKSNKLKEIDGNG
jgi:ABC-type multidrug transport system ATPase subunit